MAQILTHTPLYVWGILFALILLGLSFTRSRQVSAMRLIVPHVAFLIYGLYTMMTRFHAPWLAVGAWLVGLAVMVGAAWFSNYRVKNASYDAANKLFQIGGSWWPMIVIMITFLVNYGLGVMQSIAPQQLGNVWLIATFAFLFGLCLGAFTARMIGVLRLK